GPAGSFSQPHHANAHHRSHFGLLHVRRARPASARPASPNRLRGAGAAPVAASQRAAIRRGPDSNATAPRGTLVVDPRADPHRHWTDDAAPACGADKAAGGGVEGIVLTDAVQVAAVTFSTLLVVLVLELVRRRSLTEEHS